MNYYIKNNETMKLELHFEKESYIALSQENKNLIKHKFLFSRFGNCWVSRAKEPNLYYAIKVANELGLEDKGTTGERLSFAEQQEIKVKKAERRVARYECKSEKAMAKGDELQKELTSHNGDVAYFTQPNINSSSGRTFTRQRERAYTKFENGIKEHQKAEYYNKKADIARETTEQKQLKSRSYLNNRINECEANIRALGKNVKQLKDKEYWQERLDQEKEKLTYWKDTYNKNFGDAFSQETIKKGDIVINNHNEILYVINTGKKNITPLVIKDMGTTECMNYPFGMQSFHNSYLEIKLKIKDEEKINKLKDIIKNDTSKAYHKFFINNLRKFYKIENIKEN